MISEALQFWNSVSGKISGLIRDETKNAFRCERYEVTTAPNGSKIGVTLPYGTNQLLIPYSKEVASASVGDTVLVVWWGSMSNAKAYYFADGYEGAAGSVRATITIPLAWADSGNGYYTATPTVDAYYTSNSKIDLQPDAALISQLQSDGVEALYVENNSMALTAYAIGNAPSTALTMQCTVTESEAATPPTPTPIDPTIDAFYPVGSIYLAATSIDPNIVFGGTWVRIKDTFLLAAGDTYAGGTTGGEAEHTLTVAEMPSHSHAQYVTANNGSEAIRRDYSSDGACASYPQGLNTGATGGGAAHNNMPPYLAIWVWQRTA